MYLPNKIEIQLRTDEELIEENINFFKPQDREEVKDIFLSIQDSYHKFLFICYGRTSQLTYDKEILNDKEKLKEKLQNELSERDYHKFFLSVYNKKVFNLSSLNENEKNIYIRKNGFHHFFNFDFIDEKERRFNHLSHGEQTIFAQLLNIYFYSSSKNEELIFLLDEPDLSLHPNWQKQYLNEIIKLCSTMTSKKYHFLITSHSPFILSDLSKKNIIFLDKGKQVRVDIETFAANIHTLLSHGFFMKNGFMGEFAKVKIDELIEYLNNNQQTEIQNNEEAQYIINIIGEPILKLQLQKMLDSKRLTKIDRIDLIEEQIKELSSELEQLKDG